MQRSPAAGGRLNEVSISKLLQADCADHLYRVNLQATSLRERVSRVEPTRSSDDTSFSSKPRNFEEILSSAGPGDASAWELWGVQTKNDKHRGVYRLRNNK